MISTIFYLLVTAFWAWTVWRIITHRIDEQETRTLLLIVATLFTILVPLKSFF